MLLKSTIPGFEPDSVMSFTFLPFSTMLNALHGSSFGESDQGHVRQSPSRKAKYEFCEKKLQEKNCFTSLAPWYEVLEAKYATNCQLSS